jgi:hypothetical protein
MIAIVPLDTGDRRLSSGAAAMRRPGLQQLR